MRRSPATVTVAGIGMVLFFGIIDYVTGPEISFSIFYLLPISVLSWVVGFPAGIAASILGALTFLVADMMGGSFYSHASIPYWNAFVRLGFFFIVTVGLVSLRKTRDRRLEINQFIVHDLRSPLANVMTGLEILREDVDGRLDEQQLGFVQMCLVSCRRMLTLINSMLDLSRLERGRMPLQPRDVEAGALCKAALDQIGLWAQQQDIALDIEVPKEEVFVAADADVTERVLVNILANAVKFAPEGSSISVRVAAVGSDVHFSVRDQGAGVPQEWADKVFDTYVQVDSGRSMYGSGLGLAFSRRAVQAQGGRIWMESAEGEGTVVTFTLPRAGALSKNDRS